MAQNDRVPRLRKHSTGQAVVRLNGRDFYCGEYGSRKAKARYDQLVSEWLAGGRHLGGIDSTGPGLSIAEMLKAYRRYCLEYYRDPDGNPTTTVDAIGHAVRPLRQLYGKLLAAEFSPVKLLAVRDRMIAEGLCRKEINRRISRIRTAFKWAVSRELVPDTVHLRLTTVEGLKEGRTQAREKPPRDAVEWSRVEATLPHLNPVVRAMVLVQWHTGARCKEVCEMTTGAIDRTGPVWVYSPRRHKTAHRGKARRVYLGAAAQEVVRPFLKADPDAPLFSPKEAMTAVWAERRARRRTPVQPSQRDRRKPDPTKGPGDRYDTRGIAHAIRHACEKAGVPSWSPHMLRYAAAQRFEREHGLNATRALLGHTSLAMTAHYAKLDQAAAIEAMMRTG